MNISEKIKTLVKEAETYRGHGLLAESRKKYDDAVKIIESLKQIKNRDTLLSGLQRKIASLDQVIERVESAPMTPEMDEMSQELIKKLFSFSQGEQTDAAVALNEAITLTKFGQYDRALKEFRTLTRNDEVRLAAAKNAIRCHLARGRAEEGVQDFRNWVGDGRFSRDQLEKLRAFFNHILKKKGIDHPLPNIKEAATDKEALILEDVEVEAEEEASAEEEILDVNAVAIIFESGPSKGETVEFDVSFQNGNVISILIPGRQKELADALNTGDILSDVQFFSPIAIFPGKGKIAAKTQIKVGPRKGDYSIDIEVSSS